MRLAILGSTRGTNLAAIAEAIQQKQLIASIEIVISNKADAYILTRAAELNLPSAFIDPKKTLTREAYDQQMTDLLIPYHIDLIVLIGYMRILSKDFVERWANKIINVHPSLLPAHAGLMDLAVHQAVLAAGDIETGCTVHQVVEDVDAGTTIWQERCLIQKDDTPLILKQRVQALEKIALVRAIDILSN